MRIVFMGSPDFAVDSLAALTKSPDNEVVAVVTQPDRPKGRGQKVLMTAVKEYALKENLPVLQPQKVKTEEFIKVLKDLKPELIVVAAFGQFLSQEILDLPKYGCINVHASLLPKYRGAAPIHYAILNGEKESGVTIMKMDIGMDTGDMLGKVVIPIDSEITMGELHDKMKVEGAKLLLEVIHGLAKGTITPMPQNNEKAIYASLLKRDIEKIMWKDSAINIHNKVRGLNPWPGNFTILPNGKTLKIWKTKVLENSFEKSSPGTVVATDKNGFTVATGNGFIEVLEVQPESKKKMEAGIFVNGRGVSVGDTLGEKG